MNDKDLCQCLLRCCHSVGDKEVCREASERITELAAAGRAQGLAEAAKVCDSLAESMLGTVQQIGAQLCAEAIHALASHPDTAKEGGE